MKLDFIIIASPFAGVLAAIIIHNVAKGVQKEYQAWYLCIVALLLVVILNQSMNRLRDIEEDMIAYFNLIEMLFSASFLLWTMQSIVTPER